MNDKTVFYCSASQGFLQARQRAELLVKVQVDSHYKKGKRQLICFAEISIQHNLRRKGAQKIQRIHRTLVQVNKQACVY